MKKMLSIVVLVAVAMMMSAAAHAQVNAAGTMLGQEGTASDGYATINAKSARTFTDSDALLNFVTQYGGGSFSGIYSSGQGWYTGSKVGDEAIDVEADVEMYYQSATQNNKIYFHIANPFTATDSQKTAFVTQQQTTNHPMYVGITLPSSNGGINWDGGASAPTGKVIGGMKGTTDLFGRTISDRMDIGFQLSVNGAQFVGPNSAGTPGANGTIPDSTMWWNPTVTGVGTKSLVWLVKIYPAADQADGNYNLDPVVSVSPEL